MQSHVIIASLEALSKISGAAELNQEAERFIEMIQQSKEESFYLIKEKAINRLLDILYAAFSSLASIVTIDKDTVEHGTGSFSSYQDLSLDEKALLAIDIANVFRLMLRERKGCPVSMFSPKFISLLLSLIGLKDREIRLHDIRSEQSLEQKNVLTDLVIKQDIENECPMLKCIINLLYHETILRDKIAEMRSSLIKSIVQRLNEDLSPLVHFLYLRILFYVTLPENNRCSILVHDYPDIILDMQNGFCSYYAPIHERFQPSSSFNLAITEYLKVFYNLTMPGTAFDKEWNDFPHDIYHDHHQKNHKERYVKWKLKKLFASLIELIRPSTYRYIHFKYPAFTITREMQMNLKGYSLQLLLNFEMRFHLVYFRLMNGDPTLSEQLCLNEYENEYELEICSCISSCSFSAPDPNEVLNSIGDNCRFFSYPILSWMLEFVKDQCDLHEQKKKSIFLPLALIYLTRFSQEDPESRKALRRFILPSRFSKDQPAEQIANLKGKITRLMIDANLLNKHSSEDFLYTLCQENPHRLVYHLGYGNASGLLFRKQRMNVLRESSNVDNRKEKSEQSSDEELMLTCRDNQMIREKKIDTYDFSKTATLKEKEEESRKLWDLFNQLEKSGMIQVFRMETDEHQAE